MADHETKTAYKILTVDQWDRLQTEGFFSGAPLDLEDGYIHLSTADQLRDTADKHFAGQTGLVLLEVDLTLLGGHVRWEPARGGSLFPHLYGGLPMEAVIAHWVPDLDRNDRLVLPQRLDR